MADLLTVDEQTPLRLEYPRPLPGSLEVFEMAGEATGTVAGGAATIKYNLAKNTLGEGYYHLLGAQLLTNDFVNNAYATILVDTTDWKRRAYQKLAMSNYVVRRVELTAWAGLTGGGAGGTIEEGEPHYLGSPIGGTSGEVALQFPVNTDTKKYYGHLVFGISQEPMLLPATLLWSGLL